MTRKGRSGYVHDALFYASEEEYLATAVPYLREGIECGDAVLVHAPPHSLELLREALDGDERVHLDGLGELYLSPALALAGYTRWFERQLAAGARAITTVGEITFPGDPAGQLDWARMEALFNRLLARYPLRALCPYNVNTLPSSVIAEAHRSHPSFLSRGVRIPNPRYQDPREVLGRPRPAERGSLEDSAPAAEIGDLTDLGALRRDVYRVARTTDLPSDAVDDFVFAVNEVATNALIHGSRPVRIRLWAWGPRMLCTVTDHGPGISDPFVGYQRPTKGSIDRSGVGLWAARQLCDLITWGRADGNFTVRLLARQ